VTIFFSKPARLSEEEISKAMDEHRNLRLEVAVTELQSAIWHVKVRVLLPRGVNGSRACPLSTYGRSHR
jgi:hypothetical protein